MPLHQGLAEQLDAPSDPVRYVAILVIAEAMHNAAGHGKDLSYSDHLDAIAFVRGDWRTRLWCDAAGVPPHVVREVATVVEPVPPTSRRYVMTLATARQMRADREAGATYAELRERYHAADATIYDVLHDKTWREEDVQ